MEGWSADNRVTFRVISCRAAMDKKFKNPGHWKRQEFSKNCIIALDTIGQLLKNQLIGLIITKCLGSKKPVWMDSKLRQIWENMDGGQP